LIQYASYVLDPAFSCKITFQVMAIPFQSTSHHHTVNSLLKGVKHLYHVQFAGAGNFDNPHIGWVLESHSPGQIGGSVGAMLTTEGHYLWVKIAQLVHRTLLISAPLKPLAQKRL
jgi:hypothetical protein